MKRRNEKHEGSFGQHQHSDRCGNRHFGVGARALADGTFIGCICPLGELDCPAASDSIYESGQKAQRTAVKEASDQQPAEGDGATGAETSEANNGTGGQTASPAPCQSSDLGLSACAVSKGNLGVVRKGACRAGHCWRSRTHPLVWRTGV